MTVKRYEVDYDLGKGRSTKTILKLSDAEAKRLGLLAEESPAKKAPAKKAPAKKRTPANKARTAQNKG